MNIMDILTANNLIARNAMAAAYSACMSASIRHGELHIEDVEYEELDPEPTDTSLPVLELVSHPTKKTPYEIQNHNLHL